MTTPKKAPKKTAKKSTATEPTPKKAAKAKKIEAPLTASPEEILNAAPVIVAEAPVPATVPVEVTAEAVAATEKIENDSVEPEPDSALYQGTTSVVLKKRRKKVGALAAEDKSSQDSPQISPDPEATPQPRPPAKLERLQKILAAAGVASRRAAEGLIEQGRVQVNGKIVTVLGTKADAGRDHIRVDGKLLQGPERLRYFILNKPRGFVTTVKDPEGRPTVMQFFDKMKERLYPVGRLDYLSEGLLVVTNDGELANKLTKASSGVEKTYLVKVAGQPSEAELDILRGGVTIALGQPGSRQIRTSPARIRQVRQGDNPWYEVVLIEGRNRELRKMFEEIGHFVEKIRRTGYGPLVLDQEPGNLRELEPEELEALRKAADGTLRTPKSKDLRRRNLLDAGLLPTVLPKPSSRPRLDVSSSQPPAADRPGSFKPKKFGQEQSVQSGRPTRPTDRFASGEANKLFRPARPSAEGYRPAAGRTSAPNPVRSFSRNEEERPRRTGPGSPANFGFNRPAGRSFDRPDSRRESRPDSRSGARPSGKPAWKKPERPENLARSERPARPQSLVRPDRPARPDSPARLERATWPDFKRQTPPRREVPARENRVFDDDLGPIRPPNLHIEEITGPNRQSTPRPASSRPGAPRSSYRPNSSRPSSPRPYSDRPASDRSSSARPSAAHPRPDRPAGDRPSRPIFSRPEGARPSFTSSGKPRPGGPRPSSKPGKFAKPMTSAERSSSVGWKPGWKPKPASTTRSKPKPGSSAKPSHRVKPLGKSSGKKRNY